MIRTSGQTSHRVRQLKLNAPSARGWPVQTQPAVPNGHPSPTHFKGWGRLTWPRSIAQPSSVMQETTAVPTIPFISYGGSDMAAALELRERLRGADIESTELRLGDR